MTTRKEVLESPTLLNLYAALNKPLPGGREEALGEAYEALVEIREELRAMRASGPDEQEMHFRRCPII
jgi:hypothetical protein